MNATKISKKDALLLTAAGLGMAMSGPAEEGQKIVQATLQSYVLPQRSAWVFYGLQCYIEEALEELKRALPEVPAEKFKPPLAKVALPGLLNVAVFVHLVQRKLAEAE